METTTPANKRLHHISEIACPDSCNQTKEEKGCHFRMGPDRFTCTKCQLRIWRNFMGYELSPADLQEMLHGEKVTSSEKTLTWKKEGKETIIRGRLLLNEEYKVRIAPKLKSKQATDEICPKCKTAHLQLITAIDDSKWYGCNGYPQCRFTRTFIPHTFKTVLAQRSTEGETAGTDGTGTKDERRSESGCGQSQSSTLRIKKGKPPEKQSTRQEKAGAETHEQLDSVVPPEARTGAATKSRRETTAQRTAAPEAVVNAGSDPNGLQATSGDTYQRIPKFVLRMLKLVKEPTVKRPDASSLSK